ncbi:virulence-associated E family protein [Bradyrhizobium sp.]|uniref:virulence-associated E family protein n=1 Tax=Bradyrhizobium sp. TaxID=376 RepID=UPI0026369CB4|nr:virulence-associated E family protein [Bradyrhizobium sp.]
MSQSPVRANALLVPLGTQLPDEFADYVGSGPNARPSDTFYNSMIAIKKLGIDCSYNIFRGEYLIGGGMMRDEVGEISDDRVLALRELVRQNFRFEPSTKNMDDAVRRMCTMRGFHPIKSYFASLPQWDGIERTSRLLPDYFNTPDTPLNRAISRIVMMASVRRIRVPGCKFDYMVVLQSPEGFNKSSAISALYGQEYFTDQSTIGLSAKEVEEVLRGMWAQESPELSGITKADWNKLKASLSRGNDRVRRAFGRNPISAPRTAVQWGTTNDDAYLRAASGENRRFLSADVLRSIDVTKIIKYRDDLWAEAVELEETGESIALPEEFWADARAERDKRTEIDPWEDALHDLSPHSGNRFYGVTDDEERAASAWLLGEAIGIEPRNQQPAHGMRLAKVMRKLGWSGPKLIRINRGEPVKGYTRQAKWLTDLL